MRNISLGLTPGKVYELAIFGANRHPVDSDLQMQVSGLHTQRSYCTAR